MGFGGISIWQLLIILAIVVLLFGTKKFRNIGSDLGGAVKGFKKAMNEEDKGEPKQIEKGDAQFSEASGEPNETKQAETDKTSEK